MNHILQQQKYVEPEYAHHPTRDFSFPVTFTKTVPSPHDLQLAREINNISSNHERSESPRNWIKDSVA